nr:hypothetical protein [Agrobacterium radiobacter]
MLFSEPSEFLHQLVGGRREPLPLTEGRISSAIYSDRVIFGRETVEIRHEAETRYARMFGFKEYPATTRSGMLDRIRPGLDPALATFAVRMHSLVMLDTA